MSNDKPQVGKIEFSPDYESTKIPPLVVSLSGQNELGTAIRAYEKRIAELEAALRGLLGDDFLYGYDGLYEMRYCRHCSAQWTPKRETEWHKPDCAYVKAHQLLGDSE